MGKLLLPRDRPQRTFLQKFYEGMWEHLWHRPEYSKHFRARRGPGFTSCYRTYSPRALALSLTFGQRTIELYIYYISCSTAGFSEDEIRDERCVQEPESTQLVLLLGQFNGLEGISGL